MTWLFTHVKFQQMSNLSPTYQVNANTFQQTTGKLYMYITRTVKPTTMLARQEILPNGSLYSQTLLHQPKPR
jgi:hypothetical protein